MVQKRLKENSNQYVNPRNNHHVLIYREKSGNFRQEIVTFWTAVERKKQKQPIYQLPPEYSDSEIVTTLQINDTFLLGLSETNINWDHPNHEKLKQHLYRVQKVSLSDYVFRMHNASTLNNKEEEIRIKSLKKFFSFSPVKVKITPTGKIKPI